MKLRKQFCWTRLNSPVLTVCKTNALETEHWQTTWPVTNTWSNFYLCRELKLVNIYSSPTSWRINYDTQSKYLPINIQIGSKDNYFKRDSLHRVLTGTRTRSKCTNQHSHATVNEDIPDLYQGFVETEISNRSQHPCDSDLSPLTSVLQLY
jgi:hypothetical protein